MTGAAEGFVHVSDSPGNAKVLPRAGGTYVLVLRLARACERPVGRLGTVRLQPGMYCYVGSAFGPGGLRARLHRHARWSKRCHWHVDHLRAVAGVAYAWFLAQPRRCEHDWARTLAAVSGLEVAVPGFGASDCDCPGHLFRAAGEPDLRELPMRLAAAARVRPAEIGVWRPPDSACA